MQADTSGYYLLGYYSSNAARDGRWRTIKVRVAGVPGARLRFREGYYAAKDFGIFTTEDRERQLEQAINSETPLVELPLAVDTSYFKLEKNQVFVAISAKLASSALQWAEKSGRRQVEFDFAAEIRGTQSNRVAGALRDTITVKLDAERFQQVQQNALVYQGGIILPPGEYKLKFLARDNDSGRIGTFEDDLKLPPSDGQSHGSEFGGALQPGGGRAEKFRGADEGVRGRRQAEGISAGRCRAAHRAQRDARVHEPADAIRFLPGVRA